MMKMSISWLEKNSNVKEIDNKRLEIFPGDVTNIRTIREAIKGCKTVFHMASLVKAWVRDPLEFYRVNVEGFKNVMECALEEGVTKFIYTSSFMAVGPSNGKLNAEDTQHDPDHLHNHYERTKYIADQLLPEYLNKGLPVITVYPCVIYGPGEITEGNLVVRIILDYLERKIPGILGRWKQVVELCICHRCGKRPFAGDGKRHGWSKVYSCGRKCFYGKLL